MSLDKYLNEKGLGFPRYIKIDTEGAEISILRGMTNVLKSGATVLCELHPYAWEEFGVSFGDFLQIIRDCKRSVRYLDGAARVEDGASYKTIIIE